MTSSKIVVCGAGFLGRHIVKTILNTNSSQKLETLKHRKVQLSSRNPKKLWDEFNRDGPNADLLPPVSVDITQPSTLREAFHGADWVVSLVGVMHGTPSDFNKIQWHGAENVAIEAKKAGARLIHFSAIGADPTSDIPYVRTKGLAEEATFGVMPNAVVIRPSLVFGPEDDFFNRFAKLSKFLPFLPVFGDGATRFQPVFVDDLARAVEAISRNDPSILKDVEGRIIEAGGPETYTYRQLMEIVLEVTQRWRPILSLPFAVGMLQGVIMEQLPVNPLTLTRGQVEQLKSDNVVDCKGKSDHLSLKDFFQKHRVGNLESVHDVLPLYIR